MKTLKDFTPEIQAKIPQYIERYTKGVFDGGRYNGFKKENAEKLIYWNYEKCGYKKPVVLVAGNPLEAQIMFNYISIHKEVFFPIIYLIYCIKNNIEIPKLVDNNSSSLRSSLDSSLRSSLDSSLRSSLNSSLNSSLDSSLDSSLRSSLYSSLRSSLDSSLHSSLDSSLRSSLYSSLDSSLRSSLHSSLRSSLHSSLRDNSNNSIYKYTEDYLFTMNVFSNALLAWWKFIKDEFNINTPAAVDLDSWNELYTNSGVYSAIFSELICVVAKYPKMVHRNTGGRLHNTTGVCVEWESICQETEFNCYYINGREIPKDQFLFAVNGNITKDAWLMEKNEDIKAAWFEILGSERVMKTLGAEQVDSTTIIHGNGDLEELVLFKTPFILEEIGEPLSWVKFICPSTGSNYLISVNPGHEKVIDAVLESCPFFGQEILSEKDYIFSARG